MKIDTDRVVEAVVEDSGLGFCLSCGETCGFCELDARNYECEHCGESEVFGAQEVLLMGEIC